MHIAKVRPSDEQWIEPPEPALDRYLLRTRRPAANDNRRPSFPAFYAMQIGACAALIGVVSLIAL